MTANIKWLLGIVTAIITAVAVASVTNVPNAVITVMDSHNDGRYLLVSDWRTQQFQQQLSTYRSEEDTLQYRLLKAQTPEEKALIQQQINRLKASKSDYIETNKARTSK